MKKERSKTARPLKLDMWQALHDNPLLREALDNARIQAQQEWQDGIQQMLEGQGIHWQVAKYASRHSLEVSTAQTNAERIQMLLDNVQKQTR